MNPKSLKIAEFTKGIEKGLAMNKNLISENFSNSANKYRELASKQAEQISKLTSPKLPALDAATIGKLTLGNTCTH